MIKIYVVQDYYGLYRATDENYDWSPEEHTYPVGKGVTPEEAVQDFKDKMQEWENKTC